MKRKFKVGDKVNILWEQTPYISGYENIGEVCSIASERRIIVSVRRTSPLWRHSYGLAFHPEHLVMIAGKTQNGDML